MGVTFEAVAATTQEALQVMGQYFWALLPALVAIVLALITKEVYISLFVGIFAGAMYIGKGNPITAFVHLFNNMAKALGPDMNESAEVIGAGHTGVIIFILELGILVAMINKAGGAQAFGNWVHKHIKSRRGAMLATTGLGCCMFMDDYFNRLSVGSIMQPVNDRYRISRVKSAFLVGTISVSVCILVPISSWASTIAGNIGTTEVGTGFAAYIQTIFCNFYPILILLFLIVTSALGIDLFGLFKHEKHAIMTGDVTGALEIPNTEEDVKINPKGKVWDLIIPIAVLIASCCTLLLLRNKDGSAMFDTNTALAIGGCLSIISCLFLYLPRRLMKLKEYTGCFATGFKSIADVIIILAFAWTLTGICQAMNLEAFVQAFAIWMGGAKALLPAIFFLAAMGTAFATGTSWGTFGIMVPVVAPMGTEIGTSMMILTISAVLSGAVFGDQVSPISDATILSAASCKCNHLGYVKAQMPSALIIAAITLVTYLAAGLTGLIWVGWVVALALFTAFIVTAYFIEKKHGRLTHKIYKQVLAEEAQRAQETPAEQETVQEIAPTEEQK